MSFRGRVVFAAPVAALLALGLPLGAAAQVPARANLSIEYSYLREIESDGAVYATGWLASVASRARPFVSWVGEVGGSYRAPAGVTQTLWSSLGGARFSHGNGGVMPFAQGLVGIEHFSEPGFSQTGLALQPGGGVDVALTNRLALRAQVDYRWVRAAGNSSSPAATLDEWRVGVGVAIGLGR